MYTISSIKHIISSFRTEIMGLAILLIMLFHLGVLPFGECGVDIFLFLSGFSMYHSLSKNSNVVQFYKKRVLRILPAYFIVAMPYFAIKASSMGDFLMKITNLGIVMYGVMDGWWFVTMILLCYLIAPIIYKMFDKLNVGGQFCIFITLLIVCIGIGENFERIRIFIVRFPAFLLGMSLGFDKFTSKRSFVYFEIIVAVMLTVCFGILLLQNHDYWIYRKSFYTLIVYPLVLFISYMVGFLPVNGKNSLAYLGQLTLELYLVHESLMKPLAKYVCEYLEEGWLYEGSWRILSILLSIPVALALHQMTKKIVKNDK